MLNGAGCLPPASSAASHGLLDHAEYLLVTGNAEAAAAAIAEARDLAGRLRCQPLLDRAAALTPEHSATAAPQDSLRVAR
jgi:hypothetical protein